MGEISNSKHTQATDEEEEEEEKLENGEKLLTFEVNFPLFGNK